MCSYDGANALLAPATRCPCPPCERTQEHALHMCALRPMCACRALVVGSLRSPFPPLPLLRFFCCPTTFLGTLHAHRHTNHGAGGGEGGRRHSRSVSTDTESAPDLQHHPRLAAVLLLALALPLRRGRKGRDSLATFVERRGPCLADADAAVLHGVCGGC